MREFWSLTKTNDERTRAGLILTVLLGVALAFLPLGPAFATWGDGHDVMGSGEASRYWYFAEGTTRDGFDTYLCLQNPGEENAVVDIDYYSGDGQSETKTGISLSPQSRFTIAVHEDDLGIGRHNNPHGDVSIKVTSTNGEPIISERSMYFVYGSRAAIILTAVGDVNLGGDMNPVLG